MTDPDHSPEVSGASRAPRHSELKSYLSHHKLVMRDSLDRLIQTPFSTLINWSVIGVALALPTFFLLFLADIQQVVAKLDKEPRITLYLDQEINQNGRLGLLDQVRKHTHIAEARLITREQGLANLKQSSSSIASAVQYLEINPLPDIIVATPSRHLTTADQIEQLKQQLMTLPDVDAAEIDLIWVKRLFSFTALIEKFVLSLGLLIAIAVILVVGNTVRLLIESRKEEIEIIKLVGGTDAFVRRPFLYGGLWIGLGGGIVATALIEMTVFGLNGPVREIAELYASDFRLSGLDFQTTSTLLILGSLLGWLGSRVAVSRHLADIEP